MADKPNTATEPADSGNHRNYNERRWLKPSRRAQGYAEERKLKVHKFGNKKGEELTEYDKGIRSGYLTSVKSSLSVTRTRPYSICF